MANGDDPVWKAIDKLRDDHKVLARDGCGHKEWHEKASNDLRADLTTERKDREAMGEKLLAKLDKLMVMVIGALGGIVVILLKTYIPAIFGK